MFHADTDEEIKSYMLNYMNKQEGTVRILFTTTAFGISVDCMALHNVIYLGPLSDIDDHCQETGHIEQDAVPSEACLLLLLKSAQGTHKSAFTQHFIIEITRSVEEK